MIITEELMNFAKRYNYAITDPELIRRYRMIEDGKRDIATRISVAEKKARAEGEAIGRAESEAEGWAEGRAQQNRENARGMKDAGIAISVIARITGLSEEEIAGL